MSNADRRQQLLEPNGGVWEGWFIRLGADGRKVERFPTRLEVLEREGVIEASLTYRHTGKVATLRFADPPAEMEIAPGGHWSLGPNRTGPWPCLTELCLVHGDRRRRVVVHHGPERLKAVVFVSEGRPGRQDPPPIAPLEAVRRPVEGRSTRVVWQPDPEVELETEGERAAGEPLITVLRWQPEPGVSLKVRRAYGANGLPQPSPAPQAPAQPPPAQPSPARH